MTDIYHKIADIVFRTLSDTRIRHIQDNSLKEFQTQDPNYNVCHEIISAKDNDSSVLPFKKKEREFLLECSRDSYIDNSTLIIPPIVYDKAKLKNTSLQEYDLIDFSNPMLQSKIVRKELEYCFKSPEYIKIQFHSLSITIYNYLNRTINIFYSPECNEIFKDDLINNGIRRMFTSFLPTFSAAMIHSSALLINGKVGIFLAPDEGGKTTAAKLGTEYPILSDDQNIIKKEKNEFTAYSTPWGNNINHSLKGPVKGLFLLVKGNHFKLTQLKPKDLFSYLWNEHLFYSKTLPEKYRLMFFDFIYDFTHSIKGYQLTFQKDFIDWNTIEDAMH